MQNVQYVGPPIGVSRISGERRDRGNRPMRCSLFSLKQKGHLIKAIYYKVWKLGQTDTEVDSCTQIRCRSPSGQELNRNDGVTSTRSSEQLSKAESTKDSRIALKAKAN
jgi:hypothetical protein